MSHDVTENPGVSPEIPPNQAAFLAAFEASGQIGKAAEAAGISPRTHYRWLDDPKYAAAFEDAKRIAGDGLKDEARRRAVEGLRRYKFTKSGKPIMHPITNEPYYEDVRSDGLLTLLIKAQFPDEFKDRSAVDVSNRYENMSEEALRERAEVLGISRDYRLPHQTQEGTQGT